MPSLPGCSTSIRTNWCISPNARLCATWRRQVRSVRTCPLRRGRGRVDGWFIPAPKAWATLLFCHGNAGNISHRLESIRQFRQLGLNVFIFDYRGYGVEREVPTEAGTYRDAEAARRYLVETQG